MKKPIHPVAVLLCVIAVVYMLAFLPTIPHISPSAPWTIWIDLTRAAFTSGAELFGIGVLVELVDQIRWNALPLDKQKARRSLWAVIRGRNA